MDLKLTQTGDLAIEGGDLVLLSGAEELAQRLRIRLRLFAGEWFLAPTEGIPYFERILGQKIPRPALLSIFRDAIRATPGVREITRLDVQVDAGQRAVLLSFDVLSDSGETAAVSLELAP